MIPEIMFLKSSWLYSDHKTKSKTSSCSCNTKALLELKHWWKLCYCPNSILSTARGFMLSRHLQILYNFRWWNIQFVDFPQIFGVSNIDSLRSSFHKFWLNWNWFVCTYFGINISDMNSFLVGLEGSSYIMIYHVSIIST